MSVNDVTGDRLVSAVPTEKYRSGWDAIFGKPKEAAAKPMSDDELELWSQMMGFYDVREELDGE